MSKKIIDLLEKALKGFRRYQEPPIMRIGEHPLKAVYDDIYQALELIKQQPTTESINADLLAACEAVSKLVGDFRPDPKTLSLVEAAIAKAKQVGK